MTTTAGALSVKVTADTSTFMAQTAAKTTAAGSAAATGFSKAFVGVLGVAAVGTGVAMFLKSSVSAAGEFQQSLNVLKAAAGATGSEMKMLSDLAIKMGQDTVYSSGEAAQAMLELAKSGMSPAQIEAGALSASMNLAATEGIALADSATIVANALNTFGLKANQAGEVSDALAGGATASSASVSDMAMALQQVGPAATNAGLDIQDTTAALAAFADQGIRGSDAGTSLKTFLMRLVPATDRAATGLAKLGVDATKPDGSFRSLTAITEQLSKGTAKLTQEQRAQYMNMAFGSDASRAAIVFSKLGAEGLDKYTAATSKSGAAQKMADARMKGYAGALEQFKGSVETLQIAVGTALLPAITGVLTVLTGFVNNVGVIGDFFSTWGIDILVVAAALGALAVAANATLIAVVLLETWTKLVAVGTKLWAVATGILNAVMALNPLGAIVLAIIALVAVIILAYRHSETFRTIVQAVWAAIQVAIQATVRWIQANLIPVWNKVWAVIKKVSGYVWGYMKTWWVVFSTVMKAIIAVVKFSFNWIKAIVTGWMKVIAPLWRVWWAAFKMVVSVVWKVISTVIRVAWNVIVSIIKTGINVVSSMWNTIRDWVNVIREVFSNIVSAVGEKIQAAVDKVKGFKDSVMNFFSGIGDWLYDKGKELIQGLINGIGAMKDAVLDKAKDVMGPLGWVVPGSPVKAGPLAAHGGYHMRWAGQQIGLQLAEGIGSSRGAVQAASASMVGGLATPSSMRFAPGSVVGSDGANQEIRVFIGDRELTDIVRVETVREQARAGAAYRHRRR